MTHASAVFSIAVFTLAVWCREVTPTCLDSQWVIVFNADNEQVYLKEFNLAEVSAYRWAPLHQHSFFWMLPSYPLTRDAIRWHLLQSLHDCGRVILDETARNKTFVFFYGSKEFENSTEVLEEAQSVISESKFDHIFERDLLPRVKIMSSVEMGQFVWLTFNAISRPRWDYTYIGVDDFSTRIVFRLTPTAAEDVSSPWYPPVFNESEPGVFSQSFPNTGATAIFLRYFGVLDDCYEDSCSSNETFTSVCLLPSYKSNFTIGKNNIMVSGEPLNETQDRFQLCLDQGREVMSLLELSLPSNAVLDPNKPVLFEDRYVTTLPFQYYVNEHANIEGELGRCQGYKINVTQLEDVVHKACERQFYYYQNSRRPFHCMFGTYSLVLLTERLNLQPHTILYLCHSATVDGGPSHNQEIVLSWTTGLAQLAAMAGYKAGVKS